MAILQAFTPNKIADSRVVRPPRAIVLHDTEAGLASTLNTFARAKSTSAHVVIDRNGDRHQLAGLDEATYHVRAADRWRPDWLTPNPDGAAVSDVNRQTLGAELISDAGYRAAGEPYTDEQYQATADWIIEMRTLYGRLPVVGHGDLQADRSDPVDFDWPRLGTLLGEWPPVPGGEEEGVDIAALRARVAALEEDQRRTNAIKSELERFAAEADYRRFVLRKARKAQMTPAAWLIALAEAGL